MAKQPVVQTEGDAADILKGSGLFVIGQVRSRKRRLFTAKDGGKPRWAITMTVLTATQLYAVQRWADSPAPTDLPAIGEQVHLAVNPRAVMIGGQPVVRLETGDSGFEEAF
jgi:hypothetical protein